MVESQGLPCVRISITLRIHLLGPRKDEFIIRAWIGSGSKGLICSDLRQKKVNSIWLAPRSPDRCASTMVECGSRVKVPGGAQEHRPQRVDEEHELTSSTD